MHSFANLPITGFTGLTYTDIRYGDLLYRIVPSSCGLVIRKSSLFKSQYRCVGRYFKAYPESIDDAVAVVNKRFEFCRSLAGCPPQLSEHSSKATISVSAEDMLIFALDTDPSYFGTGTTPRASQGIGLLYPNFSDLIQPLFEK